MGNFYAFPEPDNFFNWNFVVFGLTDCDYEGGVYFGQLGFPEEYPMKPPSIRMITPSGRFVPNEKICLSLSDFHPESWNPTWKIETIIIGLISFMTSEDQAVGTLRCGSEQRRKFAKLSFDFNVEKIPAF